MGADHEPSAVVAGANWYCSVLQEIAERAEAELFVPAGEQMLVFSDELEQLVMCHQHLQALSKLIDAHAEALGEMVSDAVAEFGGSLVTDRGLAITAFKDGRYEAVSMTDVDLDE